MNLFNFKLLSKRYILSWGVKPTPRGIPAFGVLSLQYFYTIILDAIGV